MSPLITQVNWGKSFTRKVQDNYISEFDEWYEK